MIKRSQKAGGVEDVGALMTVQVHEVALGNYHGFIRFKPENQDLYQGNPNFKTDPSDGELYTTLGAGPEGGKLVSEYLRKRCG